MLPFCLFSGVDLVGSRDLAGSHHLIDEPPLKVILNVNDAHT